MVFAKIGDQFQRKTVFVVADVGSTLDIGLSRF